PPVAARRSRKCEPARTGCGGHRDGQGTRCTGATITRAGFRATRAGNRGARKDRRPVTTAMNAPRIVLGSTSRYRAGLLRRIIDDFEQVAPDTDETPLP